MHVSHARNRRPANVEVTTSSLLRQVSTSRLREHVESIAFSRHYEADRRANVRARDILLSDLKALGYKPSLQGNFDNIVATSGNFEGRPVMILGAHYDSVPGTPGADDNGSAVSVCLECARLLRAVPTDPIMFVFFNREEDGLLGSQEFVAEIIEQNKLLVKESHIFEMVGYCTRVAGSQRMPPGLPNFAAPDVGDFIGLLANRQSNAIAEELLKLAATYIPETPVAALKVHLGIERYFGHLQRSDHAPFWQAGVPSIMWTDTSEFRNPHYHQESDTPETLDFDFVAQVTRLAIARAIDGTR